MTRVTLHSNWVTCDHVNTSHTNRFKVADTAGHMKYNGGYFKVVMMVFGARSRNRIF